MNTPLGNIPVTNAGHTTHPNPPPQGPQGPPKKHSIDLAHETVGAFTKTINQPLELLDDAQYTVRTGLLGWIETHKRPLISPTPNNGPHLLTSPTLRYLLWCIDTLFFGGRLPPTTVWWEALLQGVLGKGFALHAGNAVAWKRVPAAELPQHARP